MTNLLKVQCSGLITRVMKSAYRDGEETAEISIDVADPLYREIRIVNAFADGDGVRIKAPAGTRVHITIEVQRDEVPRPVSDSSGDAAPS